MILRDTPARPCPPDTTAKFRDDEEVFPVLVSAKISSPPMWIRGKGAGRTNAVSEFNPHQNPAGVHQDFAVARWTRLIRRRLKSRSSKKGILGLSPSILGNAYQFRSVASVRCFLRPLWFIT
jgi:hypothetical protein